jgi:exopolysaccharide production protein ExoZ
MVTVALITISHYKPLKDNKVSQLGDISYSIYLIHVPLTVYCFGMYRDLAPLKGNAFLNPLFDIVLLVVVVYISKAMYRYVELPSINIGKRLAKTPPKQKPLLEAI